MKKYWIVLRKPCSDEASTPAGTSDFEISRFYKKSEAIEAAQRWLKSSCSDNYRIAEVVAQVNKPKPCDGVEEFE